MPTTVHAALAALAAVLASIGLAINQQYPTSSLILLVVAVLLLVVNVGLVWVLPKRLRLELAEISEPVATPNPTPSRPLIFLRTATVRVRNKSSVLLTNVAVRLEACVPDPHQAFALALGSRLFRGLTAEPGPTGSFSQTYSIRPRDNERFAIARKPTGGEGFFGFELCFAIPEPHRLRSAFMRKMSEGGAWERERYRLHLRVTADNSAPDELHFLLTCDENGQLVFDLWRN